MSRTFESLCTVPTNSRPWRLYTMIRLSDPQVHRTSVGNKDKVGQNSALALHNFHSQQDKSDDCDTKSYIYISRLVKAKDSLQRRLPSSSYCPSAWRDKPTVQNDAYTELTCLRPVLLPISLPIVLRPYSFNSIIIFPDDILIFSRFSLWDPLMNQISSRMPHIVRHIIQWLIDGPMPRFSLGYRWKNPYQLRIL